MTENQKAIQVLLNREEYADKLTEWEIEFLDNIQHRKDLSPNQQKKLDEIWERCLV